MKYLDKKAAQISFPLGGIGTGCIGLAGNGSFVDMEIDNHPNKDSSGECTHFAIKAEDENGVIDARVLNGDLPVPYTGHLERGMFKGYGHGPDRGSMAGVPHFEHSEFEGTFPLAQVSFADAHFPGDVTMKAFNPLIPTNTFDSSLPVAFFTIQVKNTASKKLDYTVAFSTQNCFTKEATTHCFSEQDGVKQILMANCEPKDSLKYGDLTIATNADEVSYQEFWYRGSWFDNLGVYWADFTAPGKLKNRTYPKEKPTYANVGSIHDGATIAAHFSLEAGEEKELQFVFSWNKPWRNRDWVITDRNLSEEKAAEIHAAKWKNYYATQFETSAESASYALRHFDRLQAQTMLFHDAMVASDMPAEAIDAVTANLAVLKSPTCLRLEDGSFYAFEGVHAHEGSCEGTCTHVWTYAYALAYLFPELERSARSLEYQHSMQANGGMGFRVQLPVEIAPPTTFRACVDGQFGCVIRVYREYMLSGDTEWLKSLWPEIKRSIDFAWSEQNPDKWDLDKDGIMEGLQHHTLDMELFGPNAWLSGMYLTGLQAAIRLANVLEDAEAAAEYQAVYESGCKKLNETLFNGSYYGQLIDLGDKTLLSHYDYGRSVHGQDVYDAYWNEETNEIKYQVGVGCGIDQVLGQWHADLLHLGRTFDEDKTKTALASIYKNNYVPVLREHFNPCRIYGLCDEAGTVICSYPDKETRPKIGLSYAEETMHGFEYQAASHMILNGMEEEGLTCVRAIRNRYDGERRNPWNEMECGSNYARSMASYALLLAYSGFYCNVAEKEIGFAPLNNQNGSWFFSLGTGFGKVSYTDTEVTLTVLYGTVAIDKLQLARACKAVSVAGKAVEASILPDGVAFAQSVCLGEGDVITVQLA